MSPTPQSPPLQPEEPAEEPSARPAATEVPQTLKQAVSLATSSRSLPPQQAEQEVQVPAAPLGAVVLVALPPYRAAALVQLFLAVRQPAALSPYQVPRLVVTAVTAVTAMTDV